MSSSKIDHLNDKIINLYEAGYSLREIGRRLYMSSSTVQKRLTEHNVAIRKRGGGYPQHFRIPHEEVDRTLYLYYKTDLSIKEMGEVLGLTYSGMYSRLLSLGISPIRKMSRSGKVLNIERNNTIKT